SNFDLFMPDSCTKIAWFLFKCTASTVTYTLSLHDALPIFNAEHADSGRDDQGCNVGLDRIHPGEQANPQDLAEHALLQILRVGRSEEHTSELQSLAYLVCRLLLEKKK